MTPLADDRQLLEGLIGRAASRPLQLELAQLLEATDGFCFRAALFALHGKTLRYEGAKGLGDDKNVLEAERSR